MEEKEKSAYREKLEAQLKEWKAKIEVLEARAAQAKAETKIEYQKQVEELRRRKEALRRRLDEARDATGDVWGEVRKGLEKAASELKEAVDRALARFK